MAGTVLFAPVGISKQVLDENGKLKYDEDGNVVWNRYSIANLSLPTLLLETDCDSLRTEAMKTDAKSRLNASTTEEHMLENSCHFAFRSSAAESDAISISNDAIAAQNQNTVSLTLAFMRKTVLKQK